MHYMKAVAATAFKVKRVITKITLFTYIMHISIICFNGVWLYCISHLLICCKTYILSFSCSEASTAPKASNATPPLTKPVQPPPVQSSSIWRGHIFAQDVAKLGCKAYTVSGPCQVLRQVSRTRGQELYVCNILFICRLPLSGLWPPQSI